ncbi:sigma 54-interacting transcriptional regulator [Acidobacteria bacterium AH-259-D05]|nr:sigma 54-interacting transcriptional regulator [Acidobacteria bacterium AH-259-D05]
MSQCSGNPFYIYEFLRLLQERGELIFHSGCWQWEPTFEKPSIPGTVVENISARLQGIARQDLNILEYLSVLERPIQTVWLAKILKIGVGTLEERLRILEKLDFLSLSGSLNEPIVLLSHDWLGRVIRTSLTARKARAIHQSIARFFEVQYLETKNPVLRGALVRHFMGAGNELKVRKHIWKAIEWLEKGHLYKEAAELAEKAIECKALLTKDWKCIRKASELLYLAGDLDKCISLSRQFLAEFPKLGKEKKAVLYWLLGRVYTVKGRAKCATLFLRQALPLLKETEDLELYAEVKGGLLCCLSSLGEHGEAGKLAKQILDEIPKNKRALWLDKQYHALSYYYQLRGQLREALGWEIKSIQAAFEHGRFVRSAGRIQNLAFYNLEAGKLLVAQKLARYSLTLANTMQNSELKLYARTTLCCVGRKSGQHQRTNRILHELQSMNQKSNHNRHIEAELYIELANNANHQLLPESALSYQKKCQDVLSKDGLHLSFVDATLALGWTWLLLGRPDRALKVVSPLNSKKIPRERGRYLLLRAQVDLVRGHYGQAWQAASKAYDSFPEYMPYYRSKVRLIQGKILLKKGNVQQARSCIQEGLGIAKEEYYFPLMVQGWALYAKYLSATGNSSRARTYCLRALQVAKHVERPALHAEVFHTLGKIEATLGNRQIAIQRYTQALLILKERLLHVSPDHRQAFTKQFILPIETDRNRIFPEGPRSVPRYFIQLRHLTGLMKETRHPAEIGEKTLHIVSESLPTISANLLLRKFSGGPYDVVASIGRCRKTGKHLLARSWNGEQLFLPQDTPDGGEGAQDSLGISLGSNGQLLGLLYIECHGQGICEDELDFLGCVAGILEIQLASRIESRDVGAGSRNSLMVDETRTIVGKHSSMQKLFEEIRSAATNDANVLIVGESGTGKELVARGIHFLSARQQGDFLPINCSALPEDLIESELFGHARGSFTGAVSSKLGLFEAASGGTLFLDEIATMPVHLQAKLLRVLEEKKVRRLGETKQRSVDVRIVAATNLMPTDLIGKGEFREDLYHRLNVYQIRVPPLRDRSSDIPLLIRYILERLNRDGDKKKNITDDAVSMLSLYSFPGNVRELENIIESAYHLAVGNMIAAEDIAWRLNSSRVPGHASSTRVEAIAENLASGQVDFWQAVRDPFLDRDLSREEVRQIVSLGLGACNGKYRRLVKYFNLPNRDYKRFLAFLSNHKCKVDFRQFRKRIDQ